MQQLNGSKRYSGVIVPMVTPLTGNGDVDVSAAGKLVEHVVSGGCMPFVAGTTGESSSLSDAQKAALVSAAVAGASGQVPVYAGISDNCYANCIDKARHYASLGASVAVCHLPSYYAIDAAQMLTWFARLADAVPLPLMLYNIPVTTGLSMPLSVIDELSRHDNVVGVKDSERGDDRLRESLDLWRDRTDFSICLGWAAMSSYGVQHGIDGIVPSSANLVPTLYRRLYDAALSGDRDEADKWQALTDEISEYYQKDVPLSRSIPKLKAMLAACGFCEAQVAPPMLTLAADEQQAVADQALTSWRELINETPSSLSPTP